MDKNISSFPDQVSVKYRMRNDKVLIRIVSVGKVRGMYMPDASMQGKQYVIEAIGPKVEDLKRGDVVLIHGTPGKDCGLLPNDSSLLVASQESVLLVIEPDVE